MTVRKTRTTELQNHPCFKNPLHSVVQFSHLVVRVVVINCSDGCLGTSGKPEGERKPFSS